MDRSDQSGRAGRRYVEVAQGVLSALARGEFAAGERMPPDRDLAVRFGVSRPVAREALLNALRHAEAQLITVRLDGDEFQLELAVSDDGRVWGCYLHGLFADAALRRAWLDSLGAASAGAVGSLDESLERLADAVAAALDIRRLEAIIREPV